jgi:hypothetical protein
MSFTESTEQKIALTAIEAHILEVLPIGHDNAILLRNLKARVGIPERQLRLVIEKLRNEGWLVLVSGQPPYGYYYCKDRSEAQEFIEYMRSRVIQECRIMRSNKVASFKKFSKQFGQISMLIGAK